MYKTVFILYLTCFTLYVLYSRRPDFFDSEKVDGMVVEKKGSLVAQYPVGATVYEIKATYPLRQIHSGDKVIIVYNAAFPSKGVVYKIWGYWLTIGEVCFSLAMIIVLFLSAVFITGKNPDTYYTAEELRRKPKYNL